MNCISTPFHRVWACAALACLVAAPASADVTLPSVIGSNMVLQREAPLPIWGWADAGEEVTVTLGESSAKATPDDAGKWMVKLPAMPAGGPHKLTVKGKNELALDNILIGEVWVCSGQSNMQWSVAQSNDAPQEIAGAKYPKIRLFYVPRVPAGTPQNDVDAEWTECNPETVAGFSAVAYFFGRKLHEELDVPIGLIHTSWGGTRIEPWTTLDGFRSVPSLTKLADDAEAAHAAYLKQAAQAKADGKEAPAHPLADRGKSTGLYNGMVHALVPFAIRGAIWYQGESNRADRLAYEQKMHALINGWRKVWGQGEFPFLYVQLAPYRYGNGEPTWLPEIWEAQTNVLKHPNTGMAVTVDIGNVADIHPKNKQDVGKRLALWALAKTYGKQDLVYSGPLYESMSVEGDKVRLQFEHVGGGLVSRDGEPLSHFTIAGADGKFVEAQAKIDGDTVVVWSEQVKSPQAVRFGWHELAEPNLSNKAGLPASPFRTDKPE